ncbi:LLM class flavin-dependent oxidoreductase [Agrobacterium larrymoorei]|uniref:LLM class flavin-dependent oxidoreductase n=1 Tax=Agrobacterium larrymoorei TaxID=160699 RepID=A0A4D7E6N1_9HYPH|nr:LLM class flavin-dependent oxidoreductase [Agrobacterium larrymoorei]QCJ01101.1 LLM class flavin-dependent oxidoreductase [Agrobacterium larrymoorei]QYA10115.1 LLM class flavin-dependent oxidoreductase [Agrobacterium larrymoorei]
MDLGLFMQPLHDPKKRTITEMLEQDREAALFIDKVGFDEIWVGEHYSSSIEPIVNPLQFLASIMADTKLKLATGVLNLPQHHPATIAGDVAQLDHMSKGRVIMGVGPGGLASDFELFDTMDKNRGEMLGESVRMIHEIWASNPPYNIPGKYWNVKVQDTIHEKLGFGPMLKPFQKPYPPVVVSIMSPNSKSAYVAGQKGWGIASANFIQSVWAKTHWEQYAMGCEAAGIKPDRKNWRVGRSILVASSDQEAADYLAQEGNAYAWYYDFVIDDMRTYNIEGVLKQDLSMPSDDITLQYCLDTMVISGSAKTVLDKLIAFVDEMGGPFGGLLAGFKEWDHPEVQKQSLQLLAEDVMPKLRAYCASKKAA